MTSANSSAAICLDSFALLSFLLGQNAAQRVREVLAQALDKDSEPDQTPVVWMCEVNLAEVSYQIIRRFGPARWVAQLHTHAATPHPVCAG